MTELIESYVNVMHQDSAIVVVSPRVVDCGLGFAGVGGGGGGGG